MIHHKERQEKDQISREKLAGYDKYLYENKTM